MMTLSIWVKGNTHTHTAESDGDGTPKQIIEWYKTHGYDFLVLSDHNKFTDPVNYSASNGANFVLVPGEEISAVHDNLPVHLNAFGISKALEPRTGQTMAQTIQNNVDSIVEAGGIPQVNHPNFYYAFDHKDLDKVDNFSLLEIYNGHPAVYNAGDPAHLSVEQIWDVLLSNGKRIYGTAVDDAHHYIKNDLNLANPGRGWIYVRVNELTPAEILKNMSEGNFYASTGVELSDYSAKDSTIDVSVKPQENLSYVIRFIGKYGRILKEFDGPKASYKLTDDPSETYVRAKIIASNGTVAWTQPVWR